MDVAIVKIGARIATTTTGVRNGNAGENRKIIDLFIENGHNVDLITKVGKKDNPTEYFEYDKIQSLEIADHYKDTDKYDVLVVINGTNNFFGGYDNYNICETYHIINNFKGKILFFYTDPLCALKQVYGKNFFKRNEKWGTDWTEADLLLQREDIIMISAASGVDLNTKPFTSNGVFDKFSKITFFEWQKSVIFDDALDKVKFEDKELDVMYGGSFRGGVRLNYMLEYMFDTIYTAGFFGKISEKQFKNSEYTNTPTFLNKVGGWDFFKEQTNRALATIIFAEETYSDSIVTMRVYASVLSNVVVFIDENYDPHHKIFPDSLFSKFLYVSNKEELTRKIGMLKARPDFYAALLRAQKSHLSIDKDKFYKDFNNLLTEEYNEK